MNEYYNVLDKILIDTILWYLKNTLEKKDKNIKNVDLFEKFLKETGMQFEHSMKEKYNLVKLLFNVLDKNDAEKFLNEINNKIQDASAKIDGMNICDKECVTMHNNFMAFCRQRIDKVLEERIKEDSEFRNKNKAIHDAILQIDHIGLTHAQWEVVDEALSASNERNSLYCEQVYIQGFIDAQKVYRVDVI